VVVIIIIIVIVIVIVIIFLTLGRSSRGKENLLENIIKSTYDLANSHKSSSWKWAAIFLVPSLFRVYPVNNFGIPGQLWASYSEGNPRFGVVSCSRNNSRFSW